MSRATSLDGLVVLRDFDARQITKRRSEDLRKEFRRLTLLKRQTVVDHGYGVEIEEAKQIMRESRGVHGHGERSARLDQVTGRIKSQKDLGCMAVEVHNNEITSHGREVARTSNLSHGHPDIPWGYFPARPGINQTRGAEASIF